MLLVAGVLTRHGGEKTLLEHAHVIDDVRGAKMHAITRTELLAAHRSPYHVQKVLRSKSIRPDQADALPIHRRAPSIQLDIDMMLTLMPRLFFM